VKGTQPVALEDPEVEHEVAGGQVWQADIAPEADQVGKQFGERNSVQLK